MRTQPVSFFSDGCRIRGVLRLPDETFAGPYPAIVQGPGWLGYADSRRYERWHRGFTAHGYAVLAFDYRGFGKSDGEPGWIRPEWQVEDILHAITYLETRPEVDPTRIGAYGMGGTGGGNAIIAAATDARIKAVVVQSVVADCGDWLRRMRREYEWHAFVERVTRDSESWVIDNFGETVDPLVDLMIASPERAIVNPKADVDRRIAPQFHLRSAAHLLNSRPLDVVNRIAPRALLITSIKDDVVTPEDHAIALYERAGAPKKLIRQSETTHYRADEDHYSELLAQFVDWYDRHLRTDQVGTLGPLSFDATRHL